MSPKTRRGRAAVGSHHKTAPRGAPTRKPVTALEELEEEDYDELDEPVVRPKRRKKRPARRRHGLVGVVYSIAGIPRAIAGIPDSSGYKYLNEAVGAYVPLIAAFCVVFAGVWAWVSFGPHTPTPRESWIQIEQRWMQPREDARQRIADEISNFTAQQAAYKAFRDATTSWMDELAAITTWDLPDATKNPNPAYDQTSTEMATQFISAGREEIAVLDKVVAAKSAEEVLVMADDLRSADLNFDSYYYAARTLIVGVEANASNAPTLALPSGSVGPCATPTPSVSPGESGSPGASLSPGASSSPTGTPGPTPSVLPSGSLGPSLSAGPSPSPSPSVEPTPCLPVTPSPGDVLGTT